jgi:hypothetical protein
VSSLPHSFHFHGIFLHSSLHSDSAYLNLFIVLTDHSKYSFLTLLILTSPSSILILATSIRAFVFTFIHAHTHCYLILTLLYPTRLLWLPPFHWLPVYPTPTFSTARSSLVYRSALPFANWPLVCSWLLPLIIHFAALSHFPPFLLAPLF